jgi:putative spermidine/putrescine transport system permease protein
MAAALVVAAPVLVGVAYSGLAAVGLVGFGGTGGSAAARIARVLSDPAVWRSVAWSVWIAGAATAISAALAIALAAAFRSSRPLDRAARAVAVIPLPIPHIVAAVLAVLILGQSGLIARIAFALGWISAPADMPALIYDGAGVGLIIALVWKETPFLALVCFSVLATRAAALEEAARTLGAGPRQVFRRVTLPILWRGMMPATVAVFAFTVGTYEAAALLGASDPLALPLLTMERYTDASLAARGDAFVLVILAMSIAAAAVALHEWTRRGWEEFAG